VRERVRSSKWLGDTERAVEPALRRSERAVRGAAHERIRFNNSSAFELGSSEAFGNANPSQRRPPIPLAVLARRSCSLVFSETKQAPFVTRSAPRPFVPK